jgi:diguanylate cyclase (GGDEF)-like protein
MLLPETGIDGALAVAEKVRRKVEAHPFRHDDKTLPVITVSLGIAGVPDNGASVPEALAAVNAALYRAEQGGRNRAVNATDVDTA